MKNRSIATVVAVMLVASALMAFKPHTPGSGTSNKSKAYPTFLFLSDVHLNTQSDTTTYGDDTGMKLWKAFLNKIERILASPHAPSFIVYTGDIPAHYSCANTCYLPAAERDSHNANLSAILSAFNNLADKYHKPIFYLPGNNDALAGDYYSFADEQQHTPISLISPKYYFFPTASAMGIATAPGMVSNPHPTIGYYSAYAVKGLRLLMLNTVIYNAHFTTVDGTSQLNDGNMQMEWLASQLADAAAKNEKVYIAMHVPPGVDAYSNKSMWVQLPTAQQDWLKTFLSLTTRYKNTIAGVLYGHTHMDELRRIYDTTGTNMTGVAISCPGVTPQHHNNPGFKVVAFDETSKALMDFTTYYTHPSKLLWGDSTYTFSGTYGGSTGTSIFERLRVMSLDSIGNCMNNIYTVKNGPAGYNTKAGIEVKPD